jgi:hypothetical protein
MFLLLAEQTDICPGEISRIPFVFMLVELVMLFRRITSGATVSGALELVNVSLHAGHLSVFLRKPLPR